MRSETYLTANSKTFYPNGPWMTLLRPAENKSRVMPTVGSVFSVRADNPDAYVRGILLNEVRDRWRRPEKAVPVEHFTAEPAVPDASALTSRRASSMC